MKFRMFATTAIVVAAFAAPAFAQSVGSAGISASTTNIEVLGVEADGQTYAIDGSVAIKASDAFTVTLQGDIAQNDGDLGDESGYGVAAAATYSVDGWRFGPTISYTDAGNGGFGGSDDGVWTFGGVAQKYLTDVTLSGGVTYASIDDSFVDIDVWTVGGEVRYFVSDTFRINGGLTWAQAEAGGSEIDGWSAGVGAEYQFAGTPWSVTGAYSHAKLDDLDLDTDTFSIGLRYSFGGDLKARDRSGADLGAGSASPFGLLF